MTVNVEEEHARIVLENALGIVFHHHDDGSQNRMPDLLSADRKHVAEVITTVHPDIRKAQSSLRSMPEASLPHCVRVAAPYENLGGASKAVREKIKRDILRWTSGEDCKNHWQHQDDWTTHPGSGTPPLLGLGQYTDGVMVLCVQVCQHSSIQPHQIEWSTMHEPSAFDPWELLQKSLYTVEDKQHGGLQALAEKLEGYPNKHLVMYPFGPPGNLTAAVSNYVNPTDPSSFLPREVAPPLSDVHLWLLYRYDSIEMVEGIHVCSGRWEKFGTSFPAVNDPSFPLRVFHYRDS
ncbi:hypothetical protein [Glutamicibacter ardleyensis]|uniref:hypothetical protein n=1 Tax=Glutamicibacter ardleyensis TaxID=225894 RepID=UPI003FD32213